MKFNAKIIILVLTFSLLSNMCPAADNLHAQPFTAFYLDSALGSRTLMNQSTVVMEATQELQSRKSPNEAFLYSLVIPGMGQLYTGAKRGYLYAAADVALLGTYFFLRKNASDTREDYRDVVRQHVTLSVLVPLRIGILLRILSTPRSMKRGTTTMIHRRPKSVPASGIGGILIQT